MLVNERTFNNPDFSTIPCINIAKEAAKGFIIYSMLETVRKIFNTHYTINPASPSVQEKEVKGSLGVCKAWAIKKTMYRSKC